MIRIASGQNFTRFQLGSTIITSLRDGYVDMPATRLRKPDGHSLDEDFPACIPLYGGKLRLPVIAYLIEVEGKYTLVDTGAGNSWEPTMGFLPEALGEAGVDANQITAVALTHTHEDHRNGLVMPDGTDTFPNLEQLWVPEAELPLFKAVPRLQRFRDFAKPFVPGQTLGGMIEAIAAPGHETGHTCFSLQSEGEQLLIWGDIVHVTAIQFEKPELTWEFDADQNEARVSRLRLMERAATEKCWVAGAHLDWPGVGKVEPKGTSFNFLPL